MRVGSCAIALATLTLAAPALAQAGPEQLEQIEPGAGEWQLEYYGIHAGDGAHSLQAMTGLSDWLAVGGEVEFAEWPGGLHLDTAGLAALIRIADPEDRPVGLGVELQVSLDPDARLAGLEGRAIVERRSAHWWGQADLILRHVRDGGEQGTGIAYAASLSRAIGDGNWLGIEVSGQAARLSGDAALVPEGQHYAGPSLTLERMFGKTQLELGAAWLQQWRGDRTGSGPRVFVQLGF